MIYRANRLLYKGLAMQKWKLWTGFTGQSARILLSKIRNRRDRLTLQVGFAQRRFSGFGSQFPSAGKWSRHESSRQSCSFFLAAAIALTFVGLHPFEQEKQAHLESLHATQAYDEGFPKPKHIKSRTLDSWGTELDLKKKYEVGKVIGEGTFAVVRSGIDRKSRIRVAIKEINKKDSELEALENEINVMKLTGEHENIVSLRGVFDGKDHLFLVMDLAEGGELFDRIIERGELSEQLASKVFASIVKGLHHLHQRHIAHLDIKPENLLLTSRNDDAGIKIADFGLAVILEEPETGQNENIVTECVGTPAYWSPEMVRKQHFNEKVDIWALGCVLYILLTGAHPFDPMGDASEAQILATIAKGEYDKENQSYLEISPGAKDLLRHMLDPNPKTRYTSLQLLQHPWLSEAGKLSPVPLSKDHITKLRGFRIIRLLRQGMQHMLGDAASDLFEVFDVDHDGYISMDELKSALELIGWRMSMRELNAMMKVIDKNNDGRISRAEFDLALRAPAGNPHSSVRSRATSIDDIELLFRVFDRDNDGYIVKSDIVHVLGLLGADVSDSKIANDMAMVDRDNDGRCDLAEFVSYWRMMEEKRSKNLDPHVSGMHVKHRRTARKVSVNAAN